tara:strand:+ start:283 stop:522 length:240 start_codon:yes stop_codon:yes gene_type:complete
MKRFLGRNVQKPPVLRVSQRRGLNEMDADKSQKKIKLLQILAEGCRKHPAYRARRPATGRCEECIVVWNARLELNDISD